MLLAALELECGSATELTNQRIVVTDNNNPVVRGGALEINLLLTALHPERGRTSLVESWKEQGLLPGARGSARVARRPWLIKEKDN